MIKGFNGKILFIDLYKKTVIEMPLTEEKIIKYLGGRGVAAEYYRELIDRYCVKSQPTNSPLETVFYCKYFKKSRQQHILSCLYI